MSTMRVRSFTREALCSGLLFDRAGPRCCREGSEEQQGQRGHDSGEKAGLLRGITSLCFSSQSQLSRSHVCVTVRNLSLVLNLCFVSLMAWMAIVGAIGATDLRKYWFHVQYPSPRRTPESRGFAQKNVSFLHFCINKAQWRPKGWRLLCQSMSLTICRIFTSRIKSRRLRSNALGGINPTFELRPNEQP